ncbi:hypothetical protein AB663_000038 [Microbacterium sp. XT11]|nr:hypothetical protein AB663_000038 [Microbacterium sp. XT11]
MAKGTRMGSPLPPPRPATRGVALGLGIPFLLGLALLGLAPWRVEDALPDFVDGVVSAAQLLGGASMDFARVEFLANLLMFVPIGALAFVLLPRRAWLLSLAIGPALSFAIESTQRLALPHREATVGDLLANSAGATAGVGIAILCTVFFAPRTSPHPSPTLETS